MPRNATISTVSGLGRSMSDLMTEVQLDTEEMTEDAAADSATPRGDRGEFASRIEALLLVADKPLSDHRIIELLDIEFADEPGEAREKALEQVRKAIEELNNEYTRSKRAFRILQVAGGRQVMTLPEHGDLLKRLRGDRQLARLTPAALEALAIVAYRQPILRADLEAIRGVACGEVLRGLLDRRLIRIVGRAQELGRPMLYGTTKEFLEVFGLASLKDLPQAKDL